MIKTKVGICIDCTEKTKKPLIAGRCQYHYWRFRAEIAPTRQPIRKTKARYRSEKRKRQEALYSVVRKRHLEKNRFCICGNQATEIHHKKGRVGELLTDDRFFLSVCRSCHTWIEENPKEAKELGYSLSRLEK